MCFASQPKIEKTPGPAPEPEKPIESPIQVKPRKSVQREGRSALRIDLAAGAGGNTSLPTGSTGLNI